MWNGTMRCLALAVGLTLAGTGVAPAQDAQAIADARAQMREAQRQLAEASRKVAELSMNAGEEAARVHMLRYLGDPKRAVIGVILGEGGRDGVRVEGVTPGGPADKAGLRSGDIIHSVRGASITGERPAQTLREALKGLQQGDQVEIGYLRGQQRLSAQVQAERQGELAGGGPRAYWFSHDGGSPLPESFGADVEAIVERALGEAGDRFVFSTRVGAGGLRLSSLNPELGRYFGVSEGVLVLEVDGEEYQGLQSGDVILEVDGAAVASPREALRALRRFEPGQPGEVKIQRDRVAQLARVTSSNKARHNFAPPVPPKPPTPPRPPRAPDAPAPGAETLI